MNYGKWEIKDVDKDFVEIIAPHPSGKGFQSLGHFRKKDLMPIVHLIAVAPDMYEALKGLVKLADIPDYVNEMVTLGEVHSGRFRAAEEALTKAEGNQ